MSTLFTSFLPTGESSSKEQIDCYIQCSDLASFRKRKNKENIRWIIEHWARLFLNNNQCLLPIIHSNVLLYCIQPNVFKLCWSSQHHKSSLIQLSNKNKTAMIHQKLFRTRNGTEINFDQLRYYSYIYYSLS